MKARPIKFHDDRQAKPKPFIAGKGAPIGLAMQDARALAALFQQGLAHQQQGRLDEAKAAYEHMLALQPHHADALHMLGVIAMQLGNYAVAAELIGGAVQSHPSNASAHLNLGLAFKALQRLEEALSCYQQALVLRRHVPHGPLDLDV